MKRNISFILSLTVAITGVMCGAASAKDPLPVRVFILAGQSNMEGQGVVDLDHPKYYNGGKGTLQRVMSDPRKAAQFSHVKDADGNWIERDDVFVRFKTRHETKKGGLSIGFAGYPGKHHIGPEFQFGHIAGAAFDEPVLLIKTAWGGKSLFKDFRPPSAGGETGPYYKQMIDEVREALTNVGTDFPSLAGRKLNLSGFVWMQGWNDMYDEKARTEYEQNLVHLIHDVRAEFKQPKLPVVIGELGNGGPKADGNMLAIRNAQRATASRDEFKGTVAFTPTADFARPAQESPNVGHGHHWFGNAESYFLIGDALGKEMLKLLSDKTN
ncbi:MAG: sialate O-acetylesterase [Planctomycetales bacterium]